MRIGMLKRLGLGLFEIKAILHIGDDDGYLVELQQSRRRKIKTRAESDRDAIRSIETLMQN
jgi:hypothetical protein|tara:strand:+ start:303 stop:485 length:183 start_codon:yes stop_codon:yes gene_type:complete